MHSLTPTGNTNRHPDQPLNQAPHPGAPATDTQPHSGPSTAPPHMRNAPPSAEPRGIKRAREDDVVHNPEPSSEPVLKQPRSEPAPPTALPDPQLLFNAITSGDTAQVRLLLERFPELRDVILPGPAGMTSLCWAAQKGQLDIVDLLLQTGAQVNACARDGSSPLMFAALAGHTEVIRRLHLGGADPHVKNSFGMTYLTCAAATNRLEVARWLLEQNISIDEPGNKGVTALMAACMRGHLEMAQWLVNQGANLFVKDSSKNTCLILAAATNRLEVARWLLEQNVSIDEKANNGTTALMSACQKGHLHMAQWLVSQGANLFVKDSLGGTCLIEAAGHNRLDVACWLLEQNVSIDEKTNQGRTALMGACKKGHLEMAQWLVSQGANLFVKDSLGGTCLMWAAAHNRLDVARWLLEHNLSVDEPDNIGTTALMVACYRGHLDMAKWLVSQGANLFVKDSAGSNCLIDAAAANHPHIVSWLLENGALPNEPDLQFRTPIFFAFNKRHWTIVHLLLEYDVDLASNAGDGGRLGDAIAIMAALDGHYQVLLSLLARDWVLPRLEGGGLARLSVPGALIRDLESIVPAMKQGGVPDLSDGLSLEQKYSRKAFVRSYMALVHGHVVGKKNLESGDTSFLKHPLYSHLIQTFLETESPKFASFSRALAGADKPVQVAQQQHILLFKLKSLTNSLQLAGIFSGKNLDPKSESYLNGVLAKKLEGFTLALKEASVIEQGEFAIRFAQLCEQYINITGRFDAAGFNKTLAKHVGIYGVNADRLTKLVSKALDAVASRSGDLPAVASLGHLSRLNGQQVLDRLSVELQKELLPAYEEPKIPGFTEGFAMMAQDDEASHEAYAELIFAQWRQISAALGVVLPEIVPSAQ